MPPKKRPARPTRTSSRRKSRGSYLGWILGLIVALAALGATGVYLVGLFLPEKGREADRPARPQHEVVRVQPDEVQRGPRPTPTPTATPAPEPVAALPYEEDHGGRIMDAARTVDMVIAQAMAELRLGPDRIGGTEAHVEGASGLIFQDVTLSLHPKGQQFVDLLRGQLGDLVPEASLQNMRRAKDEEEWLIYIDNQPTHHLTIYNGALDAESPAPLVKPAPAVRGKSGKVVIIIDDMGMDMNAARQLASLPYPVVFSILPYCSHTADVRALARERSLEIMLHLPCEPLSPNIDPGPGVLTSAMPIDRVPVLFRQALAQVPEASGVNNHMGSKFTQDQSRMAALLTEIKSARLFFLDSLTSPSSKAEAASRQTGIRILKRSVFLDVVHTPEAVLFQLKTAERLAARDGLAIAIGHPLPSTIEGLKRWTPARESNVTVARLKDASALVAAR